VPFQYILANLLAHNEGSVGVLFLDGDGETVDLACSDYTPYQMKVVGAYLGIYLRQLGALVKEHQAGEVEIIHLEREKAHIHAISLPDGYYLVLVQRPPVMVAKARETLREAARQLTVALFR
jgi:predicted regulator of Ras-like GTPase activity (Roadblock/LC7/MglB family)